MSHLLATRNPQSEARRQHLHGRLEPMPSEDRQWMPMWCWAVFGLAFAGLVVFS